MRDTMSLFGMDMSRRGNRRWLVSVLYLGFTAVWVFIWTRGGDNGIPLILLATIANALVLGGYGRRGLIKPFLTRTPLGAPAPWNNDERELHLRDRAHFYVYRFVVALVLLGYALGGAPLQHPQLGRALVLAGVVLGLTLPQAVLLWIEPDMEMSEPDSQPGSAR